MGGGGTLLSISDREETVSLSNRKKVLVFLILHNRREVSLSLSDREEASSPCNIRQCNMMTNTAIMLSIDIPLHIQSHGVIR